LQLRFQLFFLYQQSTSLLEGEFPFSKNILLLKKIYCFENCNKGIGVVSMRKLLTKEELCTGCGACEQTCSQTYFKENNREKSTIRITVSEGIKITVCSQCGSCIDICSASAIYRDKTGVVRIKKDLCVGCLACVGFCPEGAMFQHNDLLEPIKCVACGICVKQCPTAAIALEK
jgi:anaerobic carbon-monoxide dehydrogenase iron sulfur subunit